MAYPGLKSIARNTTFMTTARAVNVLARTVYVVLVARLLGPELYALLAYTQAWYLAFVPVAIFGLGNVIVRMVGMDRSSAPEVAAQSLTIRLLTTLVALALCVGIAWALADEPQTPFIISILSFALVGRAITAWAQHMFVAFEVTQHQLRQEVVYRLLELGLVVAALLIWRDILYLVIIHSVIWWVQAFAALRIVHRDLTPIAFDWAPRRWLPMLKVAVPFFVAMIALNWQAQGPIVMFRMLAGDDVLAGQFSLAMQALAILSSLPEALAASALPILSRSAMRKDGKDVLYANGILRLSFIVGAAAGLCGLTFGPWLFPLVFGARFETAGILVGPILWCMILKMGKSAFGPVMVAHGYFYYSMFIGLISATALTLLTLVLTPAYGVWGAIIAMAAGLTLSLSLSLAFSVAKGWLSVYASVVRPLAAVSGAFAAYMLLWSVSAWLALVVSLAVLALASVLVQVVTRRELRTIMDFISRRRSGAGVRADNE